MKKEFFEPFETTDITFAASLVSLGYKLIDTAEGDRYGQAVFVFKNDGTIDDLLNDFLNGELKVDPNALMNHVRNLKSAIKGRTG